MYLHRYCGAVQALTAVAALLGISEVASPRERSAQLRLHVWVCAKQAAQLQHLQGGGQTRSPTGVWDSS